MRRTGLRSTMTEREPRAPPPTSTTLIVFRGEAAAITASLTFSGARPIREAAISTCADTLSVRPWAAMIASSSVGGSCRTRREPYFVFQVFVVISRPSLSSTYLTYHLNAALQKHVCVLAQA